MDFAEVRAKYPQYKDLSDQQLAEGLHKKFYSDLPFEDFAQKVGYQAAPVVPDSAPAGGGGYNPMLGRLMGATQAVTEPLGMTAANTRNPIANAAGPLETLAQAGTGAIATPIAGLAGIGQGVRNLFSPGMPADARVRKVQESMTYQPRTGMGSGMSAVANAPGMLYDAGTTKAGEFTTDLTGSPAAGAAVKTGLSVAPFSAAARGISRTPRRTGDYTPTKNEIPTTEQLTKASKQAYGEAKESGVIVPVEGYAKSLENVRKLVTEEGINPTLHPKSTAVLAELEKAAGKPLTLQEAETLRKIAMDAEDDLNPVTRGPTPDARLAGKIVDELDDSIDALSANAPARELWGRSRRSQMLDQMIRRAEIKAGAHYTQAGMEHALRQEFKQLALNPRRMRGLTKEQKAAIEKVAMGGPVENTLRALGKFDPTTSVVSSLGSLGTATVLGPLTGGLSGALPVLGFGARRLATKATTRNVEAAREALVGRGITASQPTRATPTPLTGAQPSQLVPQAPRSAASIQADIQKLVRSVGRNGPNGKPMGVREIWLELARLEAELKRASEHAEASAPQGQ